MFRSPPRLARGAEEAGRQARVFATLGEGLSNHEIAGRLHLSEATVKTHVSRVLAKLDLRSRTQAAVAAARWDGRG